MVVIMSAENRTVHKTPGTWGRTDIDNSRGYRQIDPRAEHISDQRESNSADNSAGDSARHSTTGNSMLVVSDVKSTCGCTVPKYPKNVAIKPGESGEIEVNFDSNGRPNLQQKMVKISANTTSGGQLLRIQAFVEPKNN